MAKIVHLDLKDAEAEGQWAELENPRAYSQRKFEQVVGDMTKVRPNPETGAVGDAALAEQVFRNCIWAWHLIDADTGAALNDPKTDDLSGLEVGVTAAIGEKITELFEATVPFRSRKG